MLPAGNRIILRQFDLIPTFQTVHGADVHAVRAEDSICSLIVVGATM
jgi:hypothetical protein